MPACAAVRIAALDGGCVPARLASPIGIWANSTVTRAIRRTDPVPLFIGVLSCVPDEDNTLKVLEPGRGYDIVVTQRVTLRLKGPPLGEMMTTMSSPR